MFKTRQMRLLGIGFFVSLFILCIMLMAYFFAHQHAVTASYISDGNHDNAVISSSSSKIVIMTTLNDKEWLFNQHLYVGEPFATAERYFDFQTIATTSYHHHDEKSYSHADVFGWNIWDLLMKELYNNSLTLPNSFVSESNLALVLFNSKFNWLRFMKQKGLGEIIPNLYSKTCDKYPCVLKNSLRHWGQGVHIVHNESHLKSIKAKHVPHDEPYHLEEVLAGWGLTEGSVYGSVYKNNVLSLRCLLMTHFEHDIQQVHPGDKGIYARGYKFGNSVARQSPCGSDVYEAMTKMFLSLEAPYSGAFCADFKGDSESKLKFMEVNPRFCGSHGRYEKLFIAAHVPLAFAIRDDLLKRNVGHIPGWYNLENFKRIRDAEKNNLIRMKKGPGFKLNASSSKWSWAFGVG
jgi:hypothetical protein